MGGEMTAGGVIIRGKGGAGNRFIICGLTHPILRQEPSAVLFLFPYLVHVSARVHLSSFVGSELASKEKEVQTRPSWQQRRDTVTSDPGTT